VSPLSEKWDLRLSKSRYNSKIASDRARDSTYFDFRRDLETSQQFFWNLFWRSLGMFMNQTTPPWPETDGGAGRSNYGRVRWYDRSKWLRKEAGTTLELRTSYEIRERRVCMKPQTKLDQRRNWGINLDLKTRWPETEKIRFDAPTQLYYWKEGMPTLRMFLFYFRFFFQGSFFTFFFNLSNQTNCFCWKQQFTP